MKRKGLFLGLALVLGLGLASCGINEKSAEKINVAAAKEDHFTYEEVIKKYGTPVVNGVVSGFGVEETGVCTWYEGCENMDEVNAKLEKGKSIDVLVVTFANGLATKAEYSVAEPKED